jgi:ketosteroid isomerase-like protein
MSFDSMATAIDWLDEYRAKSLGLLDLYTEDAVVMCGCAKEMALSGRPALRSYWTNRFEQKPALGLIDLEVWRAEVVAVSYRTPIEIVRAVLTLDAHTGLITLQRCGPP